MNIFEKKFGAQSREKQTLDEAVKPEGSVEVFKTGDAVVIKRSSGEMESGWQFISYIKRNERVLVGKTDENSGQFLKKSVSLQNFLEWNKK